MPVLFQKPFVCPCYGASLNSALLSQVQTLLDLLRALLRALQRRQPLLVPGMQPTYPSELMGEDEQVNETGDDF